jgi:Tfp pilus assembly protein PilN
MIRTNLATRPFYNESAVRIWIAIIAVVAAVATVFNVSRVLHYSKNETELALQASHDEATAADLRGRGARERATVDLKEIAAESARAREANALIDRRTFSWTALFNRFEATLPPDVRITTVRPRLDSKDHHMVLDIRVVARTVEDISQFMENLEATGAFQRLNPDETRANEAGLFDSSITMRYAEGRNEPADAAARAVQDKR